MCVPSGPRAVASIKKSTTSQPRRCRSIGASVAASQIGNTTRKVSVLVAVLCYSRMTYIEFTLSQRKAEFYRCLVHALEFFGASPRAIIFDNLKTAVINGSGRAACFHPEFLALCGHYYLQPIACERRDPESKGIVEAKVRYVKHNALAGRGDELVRFEDYVAFAPRWRDEIANVRTHETTRERPVDRFQQERSLLRALPTIPFDTDEIVPAIVSPHARVEFDANRYSVPPRLVRQTVTIRADGHEVRIVHQGQVVAQHARCYERRQLIVLPEHRLAALTMNRRSRSTALEQAFDALGPEARQFHLCLRRQPVKTGVHLRRLLGLARVYGSAEVLSAIARALEFATYDAAYVENLLLAERRRRQLPTPTLPTPRRRELIDDIELEPADPAVYDRFCNTNDEELSWHVVMIISRHGLTVTWLSSSSSRSPSPIAKCWMKRPAKGAPSWRFWRSCSDLNKPPVSNELSSGGCVKRGFPSKSPWLNTTSSSPSGFPRPRSCACSTATSSSSTAVPF